MKTLRNFYLFILTYSSFSLAMEESMLSWVDHNNQTTQTASTDLKRYQQYLLDNQQALAENIKQGMDIHQAQNEYNNKLNSLSLQIQKSAEHEKLIYELCSWHE